MPQLKRLFLLLMRVTAAALSVPKQSGTLWLVMIAWVAVTLVVVEFRTLSLSTEETLKTPAIQWPVSFPFLTGRVEYAIQTHAMSQQNPRRVHHRHLLPNQLQIPPMPRLERLFLLLMSLTAAARSVLKKSGTLLLVMIVWVAVTLVVVESRGFNPTMEAMPMMHARQCRSSFRLVHAEFVIHCFVTTLFLMIPTPPS